MSAQWCAGILNGLQSSNWKERLTSMETLQQQVQDRKENLEGTNSVLIQGLSYLPGWGEKNFQVSNYILAAAACWQSNFPSDLCASHCQCAVCDEAWLQG